jgi:hypothetical protein
MSKKAITDELERIEESSDHSSQTQFSSTKFWRAIHLSLGVVAALAAALAGASALADLLGTTATGVAALAAAAVGGVLTALNPSQRAERAHVAANTYLALRTEARVMRTVHLEGLTEQEAEDALDALVERQAETNMAAPVPAFLAYLFGRRNIQKGRTTHEVDKTQGDG